MSPLNRHLVARQGVHEFIDPAHNNPAYKELKEKAKNYMIDDAVDPDPKLLFVPAIYHPHLNLPSGNPDSTPNNTPSDRRMNQYLSYNPTPSRFASPAVHQITYPIVPSRSLFNKLNNRNSDFVPQHQYYDSTPSRFNNPILHQITDPVVHTRALINESVQLRKEAKAEQEAQVEQLAKSDREARLAAVDKDALSQLSEDDRNILQTKLSLSDREALLDQLENGELDELLPREENRFGGFGAGGFSGAAAQIGASAGGFIGRKLAGALGAKLGAAAGAYLGAAAASRFVKKTKSVTNIVKDIVQDDAYLPNPSASASAGVQYGSYGGSYGAVLVNSK